jgi:hypothetical protein
MGKATKLYARAGCDGKRPVRRQVQRDFFDASVPIPGTVEYTVKSSAGLLSLTFESTVPIINYTFIKTPRDVRQEPKPERGELRFEVFDEKRLAHGRQWRED